MDSDDDITDRALITNIVGENKPTGQEHYNFNYGSSLSSIITTSGTSSKNTLILYNLAKTVKIELDFL